MTAVSLDGWRRQAPQNATKILKDFDRSVKTLSDC